jgi:hypothetical protein
MTDAQDAREPVAQTALVAQPRRRPRRLTHGRDVENVPVDNGDVRGAPYTLTLPAHRAGS